ncbi:MAG: TRAP transporter small permease [Hydrogenophaga sp.]|jgi:TRAP-type C4-dicarboxylate transport system permease small subunit|uniref:TRAP transporter small permease n=1 Tax=Hydrogenophaga sp. TaxID=1904254 RepID=UPI002716D66A|nr:TRAP transporter small permease [Hydrogenophaga sp.]MDO9200851.1 TRAP transporter small permease [Hydrogenophaga sp.]MDO9479627.1 TRAP transporter small permease [Hydrogenophaga sp.]MDO9572140.1 TRAP transporter small permease [Hydrogenophaga sp.]MDP1894113.1 TRAP transporter small permease [Hydrogenophaga sp.]MDP2095917.1 TRAP transporter small permease [Hydrogenophaga sp.]
MGLGKFLKNLVEGLMALCLLGMVLAVFGNVVQRYFWGTGWVVSEELSRLLFVWLVCLSATLAFGEGKHLGFDLVTARLSGAKAAVLRWLSRGLIALALYYLIDGSWSQVLVGMDSRSPVMNYPLALGAAGTLVMGVCMAVLLVLQSWNELRGHTPTGQAPKAGAQA